MVEFIIDIYAPSTFARQRDGRSVEANPLTQIAGQYLLLRRQLDRRDIGVNRPKLVGERSGEQLHCGRSRRHHGGRGQLLGPAAVDRAIDDRAIAKPVGGNDDRTGDLERGSAGADRDNYLAAIDDGGKNECRELGPVDDIDGDAMAAGAGGNLRVERIAGRGNNGDGVAKSALSGSPKLISSRPGPDSVSISSATSTSRENQRTCAPAARSSRNLPRADSPEPTRMTTPAQVSRNTGRKRIAGQLLETLTSIIFHIIVKTGAKREKYCGKSA
jgi:hypothetical protein